MSTSKSKTNLSLSTVKMNSLNPSEGTAPDEHGVELTIGLIDEYDNEGLEGRWDSKVELQAPPAVCDGNDGSQHGLEGMKFGW
jgi:hypothetical protein